MVVGDRPAADDVAEAEEELSHIEATMRALQQRAQILRSVLDKRQNVAATVGVEVVRMSERAA